MLFCYASCETPGGAVAKLGLERGVLQILFLVFPILFFYLLGKIINNDMHDMPSFLTDFWIVETQILHG